MERLMPIVKEAVVSGLIAQATHRSRRYDLAGLGLVVLAGFVFFLSVIFGSIAGYQWLDGYVGEQAAFMIVAGVLLLVSALLMLIGLRALGKGEKRSSRTSRDELSKMIDILADELLHEVSGPVKENPKTALAMAAIAGFIAGDHMH